MSLEIKTIKNTPVNSNCFVVFDASISPSCLVIDPGTSDCRELITYIETYGLKPQYVILTHEHFDHIWGVEKLREKYDCKVISSFNCSSLITDPKKNLSLFYDQKGFRCSPADMIIEDLSNPMNFQSYDIYFYNTPGHSSGSICIKIKNYLFTGDTLMENMKTPTKLPGGDKEELRNTLTKLFSEFSGCKKIFPGHGKMFLLKDVRIDDFL